MADDEADGVGRVERGEHGRIVDDLGDPEHREDGESALPQLDCDHGTQQFSSLFLDALRFLKHFSVGSCREARYKAETRKKE